MGKKKALYTSSKHEGVHITYHRAGGMVEGGRPMNPKTASLHVISFSGGKDSVATWLHLTKELKLPNVRCVFADTGHESPLLAGYLDYLRGIGCPLETVHSTHRQLRKNWPDGTDEAWLDSPMTMESLSAHKKRFPSTMARFCTTELKVKPLAAYLQTTPKDSILVCGVRAEESPKRAAMEPRGVDEMTGHERWFPIHDWTHQQVFDCHKRHGVEPNPLYKMGCGRVGCWPCIMATKCELRTLAQRFPEAYDRLGLMEQHVASAGKRGNATFFSPSKIPARYHSVTDALSGKSIATADDVRRWALCEEPAGSEQGLMFEDEGEDAFGEACISVYGLCE